MEKAAEPKIPQEFILDAFADPTSVRDVVRGMSSPLSSKLSTHTSLSGTRMYARGFAVESTA